MQLRSAHLIVGITGLLVFVLQGQYMANTLVVPELDDTRRVLYRSSHIYLLLASAINVALGSLLPAHGSGWLQRLASTAILLAPFVLLASFFAEVSEASIDRPFATLALYGLFGAAVLMAAEALWQRFRRV